MLEAYSDRFRGSTKLTVEKENCGRINKDTLKNFDVVLFFTTGNPMTKEEIADLKEWVKNGVRSRARTARRTRSTASRCGDERRVLQGPPAGVAEDQGEGGQDAKHPAAAGFTDGMDYQDEMYVFRDAPYSRDKLHIILSIDSGSFDPKQLARGDKDYAISWCRTEGKGKVFYTSFGHDQKVWKDERFQKHLFGGLKWATGSSASSSKRPT